MAITNAQQARQLYNEGGPMRKIKGQDHMLAYITPNEADKLVKLGGQETMTPEGILAYPPSNYGASVDNSNKSSGNTNQGRDRDFQQRGASKSDYAKTSQSYKDSGTQQVYDGSKNTSPKDSFVPTTPEKKNETIQKVVDFFDRRKQLYNFGRSLPGAKKSSFNNLTAYKNYLVSQGADLSTIDRLMEGVDEENAIGFDPFQELAYDYDPKGITDIDKLKDIFNDPTRDPFEKLTAVPQNFSDFMLTQRNNPNLFAAGDLGNFMDKPKPKDLVNPNTGELYTNTEWNALKQDIGQDRGLIGGNDNNQEQTDPCLGPNPPAYCAVNNDPADDTTTPTRNLGGLAPRIAGSIFDFDGMADGGRAGAMDGGRMMMNQEEDDPVGGIMDLETSRQMYGLGKLVKKITRGVKKVAKSPVGKAALMYFGGNALMGKMGGGKGLSSFFGKGSFNPLKTMVSSEGFSGLGPSNFAMKLAEFGLADPSKMALTGLGKTAAIGLPAILAGLMTPKEEEENNDDYYKTQGINIADIRNNPYKFMAPRFAADGGIMRNGYAEGSEEPVAKKTMPLLDMDGQEMDLREEGGFVPLGRMERADDVPARLSKNEFVFTAEAVRNAGEGDVDKGAEVMYNMMKNLESGGDVSEESQGLEGAREMFQTSQRLEEVI